MLAFVGDGALQKGCEDGVGGVETCCQVCDCDADFGGWGVAVAGYVHESHFPFASVSMAASKKAERRIEGEERRRGETYASTITS